MGDTRFAEPYRRVQRADDRAAALRRLRDTEVVAALAQAASEDDRLLANILATEAMNRVRRKTALLDHVAEGVCALDREGRVAYTNPAACRHLGLDEEDLLGREFHETVHRHAEHPGDARRTCGILDAARAGVPRPARDERDTFLRADGGTLLVGFSSAPIHRDGEVDGAAVIFRDIGEQTRTERDLHLARVALEKAPDPIVWTARDGRIVYANGAAQRHYGHDAERLCTLSVFDINTEVTPESWAEHWARVEREGAVCVHTRHRRASGEEVEVEVHATHVDHEGREFHVSIVRVLTHD